MTVSNRSPLVGTTPRVPPPDAAQSTDWHALAVDDVADRLDVHLASGLTEEAAEERLILHGDNEIIRIEHPAAVSILFRQFTSLLTILLLVAAVASGALLGEWIDAGAIFAIVVLNTTIGFAQEYRAAAALAALQSLTAPTAHVLRDGLDDQIPGRTVVPGDVLLIDPGDRVAADARLFWVRDLEMDESLLTGESLPVAKGTHSVPGDAALGDRTGMVFGGTTVARGRARAIVVETGASSEAGRVAGLTAGREPQTPLQRELDVIGRRLAVIAGIAAAMIIALGLGRGIRFETMILTGVALAVAVIPEGLPTVVTVTLARGMERMARSSAVVRRLSAVEALGAAGVICTDKTGTITENRLAIRRIGLFGDDFDVVDADARLADPHARRRIGELLDVMVGCNDAYPSDGGFRGDPLDVALLTGAEEMGADVAARRESLHRLAEVPFDSRRKRMDVLVRRDGDCCQLVKGAPEVIIPLCSAVETLDKAVPLTTATRQAANAAADAMASDGLRAVAVALRRFDAPPPDLEATSGDLVLVGLIGLADRPREGVRQAVREAHRAGIRVVMVTGDHRVTAQAIGRAVGIVDDLDEVMPGDRLRTIEQSELDDEIDHYSAFARVDPVDKPKIVAAWQQRGAVVAMTGDGVNDGPALRAADIGVAMGSGTDVAKDAAGVVLQDDNFSTIVEAVREGRKIFMNLRNVVHYLLSANASEVITMLVGFAFFGALGEPLRAAQLLWINLVSDGLPALALGLDEPADDVMVQRPGAGRDVLSRTNIGLLLTQGLALGTGAVATIVVGEYVLGLPWIATQTMVFTTLVVSQLLHAYNLQSHSVHPWGGWVTGAVVLSLLAQVAVVHLPATQQAFSVTALGLVEWAWAVGTAVVGFVLARLAGRIASSRQVS